MIELDKWESQLVYLGKHWFKLNEEGISLEQALKNLWGERCGMYARHVDLDFVAGALLKLVQKVIPNFNLNDFITNMAPQQYGETKYTDNKTYSERICWVCLYNYLSILQVRDSNREGESIELVKLMPFEPKLFRTAVELTEKIILYKEDTMKNRAKNICRKLQNHGYEAVFAGGAVRDMVLGIEPHDYDVATSATPDQIKQIFKNTKFVGESFGVSLINEIEVATFRQDSSYTDGRRPDSVEFTSMENDAKRRDLTINALFFDPIIEEYIDFIDINGVKDIDDKVIRFVGNAQERIDEDALRIMRAIRFASRFDFKIDKVSFMAMLKSAYKIETLSGERVLEELKKGLKVNPKEYIEKLSSSGILFYILPEVHALVGNKQSKRWHPEGATVEKKGTKLKIPYDPKNPDHNDETKYKFNHGDVFTHTMLVLKHLEDHPDWRVKFAAILHDIGKPATAGLNDRGDINNHGHAKKGAKITEVICKRLKMSNKDIVFITSLVRNHMKFKDIKNMRRSSLRRFINQDYFKELIDLSRADILGTGCCHDMTIISYAEKVYEKYTNEPEEPAMPEPFITGYDLISIGLKPGPKFKEILDLIMDKQLEGLLDSRLEAILFLQDMTVPFLDYGSV